MISSGLFLLLAALPNADAVDRLVESAADRDGVTLTAPVKDELFLRRVSLDLIGRIPSRSELQQFRRQPDRASLVDRLLASEEHAVFWSRLWTSTLIGYGQTPQSDRESLRGWLETQFAADRPFQQIVYELIAAEGRSAFDGPTNFMLHHVRDPVVPVGRLFLGVQLDCARCHDHPTDRWTQEDFQGMERFFSDVRLKQASPGNYEVHDQPSGAGPTARFLTGARPRTTRWRQELAVLVVTSKPFARSTVNRLWYHFFGHGIADPPDSVNGGDRPADWELVNRLADSLRDQRFQWRGLLREICLSNAYQRQVSTEHPDWPLMPTVKPMTPDQLFDSLSLAFGRPLDERRRSDFTRAAANASLDASVHNTWDGQERVQALMTRLNMPLPSEPVPTVELFERVLSRRPTREQRQLCEHQPVENILFALVNSNEFYFWH